MNKPLAAAALVLALPVAGLAATPAFHESFDDQASIEANGGVPGSGGPPTFVDGVAFGAADFAGSKRVCYPVADNFDPAEGTLEFWLRTPAANHLGLFDVGILGRANSWGVFVNQGHVILEVKNAGNSFDQAWSPGPIPFDGEWHLVSAVWERLDATTRFKVCLDGTCKPTYDGAIANNTTGTGGSFCLGWSGWYGPSESAFDEVRIYDHVRTDAEILATFVEDSYRPRIELAGDAIMAVDLDATYDEPGYSAEDNADGDLTDDVVVRGTVDPATPGRYRIAYDVDDSAGNPASGRVRRVHVVDLDAPSTDRALGYLADAMDQFHETFQIYTDLNSPGDHATPSGLDGDHGALRLEPGWDAYCAEGLTCFRSTWEKGAGVWVGLRWLQPDGNWGTVADAGFDLSGATELSFMARGAAGGEAVEFVAGGVAGPYPDSISPAISTGPLALTDEWTRYTIDLSTADLGHVVGPFGWIADSDVEFFLDDVELDLRRDSALRFIRSFDIVDPVAEAALTGTAYVYDNALALLAFIARGEPDDLRRASILADTLVFALHNDRFYDDGRLRNAYAAGDISDPGVGEAKLPGWWDPVRGIWLEDEFNVSTHTGNVAWAMLALLEAYAVFGEPDYLEAAELMGTWVAENTWDGRGAGGFTGGFEGWEQDDGNPTPPTKLLYKSTEHNIDLYPAFARLYAETDDASWYRLAEHAKDFVEAMWNPIDGHFWTGTGDDGVTLNEDTIPLDIHPWAVLALFDEPEYDAGLAWSEAHCKLEIDGFTGFDFNTDRDGIWSEGTAQVAAAYGHVGDTAKADLYLEELRAIQRSAKNSDGRGLVAATRDNVSTGFNWEYFARPHVGATAWFVFAETGYNPYWGDAEPPEPPEPVDPAEVVYSTAFESNGLSWTPEGGVWQVGSPTSGPGTCYGGSSCAATVLDGDYPATTDSRLVSPEIPLPHLYAPSEIHLRFRHWFSYSSYDAGQVQISVREGASWTGWVTVGNAVADESGAWSVHDVDLSAYAGRTVRIGLYHGAARDAYNRASESAGWYVDNLSVTVDEPKFSGKLTGWGDWSADRGVWQVGAPTYALGPASCSGGSGCAGTVLGGRYPAHTDSRLVSPTVTVPAAGSGEAVLLQFRQWFSFGSHDSGRVQLSVLEAGSWSAWATVGGSMVLESGGWTLHEVDVSAYADKTVRVAFFHAAARDAYGRGSEGVGWYVDDVAFATRAPRPIASMPGWAEWSADLGVWQVGTPTAGPGACFGGDTCAGTVLDGSYPAHTDSRLVSPALLLPSALQAGEEIRLRFRHWFSYAAYDSGQVQLSVLEDGAWSSWVAVGNAIADASPTWSVHDVDLSAYAGETVRIGLRHAAGRDAYGRASESAGWYVDNLTVAVEAPEFKGKLSSWDDWSADRGVWEIGAPVSGPGGCYGGTSCAGTLLAAHYPAHTDSRLVSPTVTVPTAGTDEEVHLRFRHWFSYSSHDSGQVQLSVLEDGTWSSWVSVGNAIVNTSTVWSVHDVDVTAYAGETVRIAFLHSAGRDAYGRASESTGWFVDNVRLVAGVPRPGGYFADWGDWSADRGVWEIGAATAGPGACYGGSGCAGTVLGGSYPAYTDSRLVSPTMTLPVPSGAQEVHLRFRHWFSYSSHDSGQVQLSVLEDGAWSSWVPVGNAIADTSPVWSVHDVDLSAYAGKTVRIGLYHGATRDAYGRASESAGWYVDSLAVTVDEPVLRGKLSGWGDWSADRGVWEVGAATAGPGACYGGSGCAGTVLGGGYPAHTDSRLVSPTVTVPAAGTDEEVHLRFRHWFSYSSYDSGQVQLSVLEDGTWSSWISVGNAIADTSPAWSVHDVDLTAYAGETVRIAFLHSAARDAYGRGSESTGWYVDDVKLVAGVPRPGGYFAAWGDWSADRGVWEVGAATAGPGACYGGSGCAGTVLGGSYPAYTDSRLVSPTLEVPSPAPGQTVSLRFREWFSYSSHDAGQVQLSVLEDGAWSSWVSVGESVGGVSGGWTVRGVDVSAYAGKSVRVGFRHDATRDAYGRASESTGWYVDNVEIRLE